jgi:hypothetical protein
MEYLNRACLESVSAQAFRSQYPYPWVAMDSALTAEGREILRGTLPDLSLFDHHIGDRRAYGQAPHDRMLLHYTPSLPLAEPWRQFIGELQGEVYQSFLRRLLGDHRFILTMEWHYSWQGCSVSPHCDAKRKLATHLFYFNSAEDWDPSWGGQTLILDSQRRFATHSAPGFDEFAVVAASDPLGQGSLLFQRTPHSWHGVRPLQCPDGKLRKLFHLTINQLSFQVLWRQLRGKDPDGHRFR